MTAQASATAAPKRENLLINIVCNIVVPTLVLTKLSGETRLGPLWGLVVALVFPLGYGVADFVRRRKANFISILGIASVWIRGYNIDCGCFGGGGDGCGNGPFV